MGDLGTSVETFAEPKLPSKYLLKSKSEVISLRLLLSLKYLLRPKFGLSESLSNSLSPKVPT